MAATLVDTYCVRVSWARQYRAESTVSGTVGVAVGSRCMEGGVSGICPIYGGNVRRRVSEKGIEIHVLLSEQGLLDYKICLIFGD